MATKTELISRWDTFLSKMKARYLESLQHAEEACVEQLEATDYEYYTVFRSWQGMKSQINQILQKIDDTWQNNVEPQMQTVDNSDYLHHSEENKANHLTDSLVIEMERFEKALEGKLSQKFYNHAIAIANKDFNCSQCGSPLIIKKDLFRAQYVSCTACNTVNTFEPETKFIQIGWNIIDNIVAYQCTPLHNAMTQALKKLQEVRKNEQTAAHWDAYKTAYLNYWETFFNERIKLKSDAKERFEEDMNRKKTELTEYENIQRYNKYGIS